MITSQYVLGFRALANTIASGGSIHQKMNDFSHNEGSNSELYRGAVDCLLQSFGALQALGIGFEASNPGFQDFIDSDGVSKSIAVNRMISSGNGQILGAIADIVNVLRAFLKFQEPATQPLEVRVLTMPPRETTTQITRDAQGNIQQAVQVERDGGMPVKSSELVAG